MSKVYFRFFSCNNDCSQRQSIRDELLGACVCCRLFLKFADDSSPWMMRVRTSIVILYKYQNYMNGEASFTNFKNSLQHTQAPCNSFLMFCLWEQSLLKEKNLSKFLAQIRERWISTHEYCSCCLLLLCYIKSIRLLDIWLFSVKMKLLVYVYGMCIQTLHLCTWIYKVSINRLRRCQCTRILLTEPIDVSMSMF